MFRNRSVDLINQETEWGMDVSEANGKATLSGKGMMIAGYVLLIVGIMISIPVVVGFFLFPMSTGLWREALIVVGIVVGAIMLKKFATSGPRNALQIDYKAAEVRLGSTNAQGVFARHRVCPFAQIQDVKIDRSQAGVSTLKLVMVGETATIALADSEGDALDSVASKIFAAKASALSAPIRSRVQTAVLGFEAGFREVGHRVRSRVVSRTA